MPYINKTDREQFRSLVAAMEDSPPETAGELHYLIANLCDTFFNQFTEAYEIHNEIMGVLSCAASEWYRVKVAPYEDKKIMENGSVFAEKI